jgi:bacillithiol biosynthesis cysteine-adding enzyme BshC
MSSLKISKVPIESTFFNSPFLENYLKNQSLSSRFHFTSDEDGIEKAIKKRENFSTDIRKDLVASLQLQYDSFSEDSLTIENIQKLQSPNCLSVTTGQQIHIGLGPLYVFYKALDTILLAKEFNKKYPSKDFVPIFWMATEDHDLEEIKSLDFYSHHFNWETKQSGAVGRMKCDGISDIFLEIKKLNLDFNQKEFVDFCITAYNQSKDLAEAFRKIIHFILPKSGIVVINADCCILKKHFINAAINDFKGNHIKTLKKATDAVTKMGFYPQLHNRDISLFYLSQQNRERIILENGIYKTVSGNVLCKESQIEDFCRENISDISPNAALRPLYQEIILPNIAYIGGQAELKYWAQLKETFEFNQEKLSVFIPRTHNIITKNLPSHINIEDWFKSDKEFLEIIDQNYQNKMQQFQNCLAQVKDDLTRLEKHSEDLVKGFNASIKIDKIQDKIIDFEQTILKFSVSQNTLDTEQKKLLKVKNTFFNREKIQEREYSVLTYVQSIKTIYDCINIKGYKSANELKTVHNVEINISNILN